MLGIGEGSLMPIIAIEALKGGRGDAAVSVKVAVGCMACLALPLVWRVYVLVFRPDLLGRYEESGDKKGGMKSE